MVAGLVLAAGASSRMGSPKALARVGSDSAIARVCRTLEANACSPILVVLGADAESIRSGVPPSATVLVHADWQRGRSSSLKAGLAKLPADGDVLVWPVDHPMVDASTVNAIVTAKGVIRIPTYQGKRGHPTLFGATLRRELAGLGDDQPLHDVVHARPERVVEVPVEDPGVLENLDRPGDVTRAATRAGDRRARPPP